MKMALENILSQTIVEWNKNDCVKHVSLLDYLGFEKRIFLSIFSSNNQIFKSWDQVRTTVGYYFSISILPNTILPNNNQKKSQTEKQHSDEDEWGASEGRRMQFSLCFTQSLWEPVTSMGETKKEQSIS